MNKDQFAYLNEEIQTLKHENTQMRETFKRVQLICASNSGHRLMQIAQPARQIINLIRNHLPTREEE
jgi:hypothetical protein